MQPGLKHCPGNGQLSQFVDGQLPGEEAAAVAEHVETCPNCEETVRELSRRHEPLIALVRSRAPADLCRMAAENELNAAIGRLLSSTGENAGGAPPRSAISEAETDGDSRLGITQAISGHCSVYVDPELPESFGRYRIVQRLGHGGMGAVYLAEDQELQRRVALKVPFMSSQADSPVVERFRREARAAAALHHAHICPIFDVGEIEGRHYLTMAFIQGHPLAEELKRQGALPVGRALQLVKQVALALAYAHEQGVVHRDLKPANIMLNEQGEPIVMDFGLARRAGGAEQVTQTGEFAGTPAYMAPEQFTGEPDALGPACDVYSLGLILYVLLTGEAPFSGDLLTVASKIALEPPAPPSQRKADLPPEVDELCMKAIAKNPVDRFGSMAEFARAIEEVERLCEATSSKASESTATETSGASRRRSLSMLLAALAAAMALLATITLKIVTRDGVITVELKSKQPIDSIQVDGQQVKWTLAGGPDKLRFHVRPGKIDSIVLKALDGTKIKADVPKDGITISAGESYKLTASLKAAKGETPSPVGVDKVDPALRDGIASRSPKASDSPQPIVEASLPRPARANAIYVMNVDGGDVRSISRLDDNFCGSPAWSHDGKRLAFDSGNIRGPYDARQTRVYVQTIRETEAADLGLGCGPQFSPDDTRLLFFVVPNASVKQGIWVMNADGSRREWLTEGTRPRWSPDGGQIVYIGRHEGFDNVYLFDMASREAVRVLEKGCDEITGVAWSPDGKQIAFIDYNGGRWNTGGNGEVAVVAAAARQTPRVLHRGPAAGQPDWSPHGKALLFSFPYFEKIQILEIGADQPRALPGQLSEVNNDAVWSPDGKQIAFSSRRWKAETVGGSR